MSAANISLSNTCYIDKLVSKIMTSSIVTTQRIYNKGTSKKKKFAKITQRKNSKKLKTVSCSKYE